MKRMTRNDDIKCPVCRHQYLDEIVVDGVAVDQCSQCRGVWYDKGEYEQLVSVGVLDLKVEPSSTHAMRYCPRDGEKLKQMMYPQTLVQIDICPKCDGFWLDKKESDEIRHVRRHLRRVGKVEMYSPITGVKGSLIRWINLSIDRLMDYSD